MTAPFFLVDISMYVIFSLAAYFFFRHETVKLFFLVILGLFVKENLNVFINTLILLSFKRKKNKIL